MMKRALPTAIQARYKTTSLAALSKRVSDRIGKTRHTQAMYNELLSRQRFIPSGNTLLAGIDPIRPNCCILPSVDESNFDALAVRASIAWTDRIGIGFDLSNAADPVQLLRKLSSLNASIDLQHRPQRGNMAVLSASHPRIEEFIACKSSARSPETTLYNFNLSVAFDSTHYDSYSELLAMCAECAHSSGDPGIVFMDRVQGVPNQNNIGERIEIAELGQIKTLVPCGEQGMFDNEVCSLGSINLACADYWNMNANGTQLNTAMFTQCIESAVQFLDDTIDQMQIQDVALKRQSLHTRRIGLGVMGFADILKRLNIAYASPESLQFVDYIGDILQTTAHEASRKLARQRGICPALQHTEIERRNIAITCIAPTGGITLLTQNKGFAIEPYFDEAHLISPRQHIEMQARWQQYMDGCISKTVNLSKEVSKEQIVDIWQHAKDCNVKSVTVYRDGSMQDQPMQTVSAGCVKCCCAL